MGLVSAYFNEAIWFMRSRGEETVTSSLDLILASPNGSWLLGPDHMGFTGSHHDIQDGYILTEEIQNTQVLGIDWGWWEEWVRKEGK